MAADWAVAIATFLVALVALFQEQFRRYWFAPALRFEFLPEPPFCHRTELRGQKPEQVFPIYYFRFGIHNEGRSTAEQCEIVLEALEIRNAAGIYVTNENFSPVNLIWSTIGQEFVNVGPGRRRFGDIGHILRVHDQLLTREHRLRRLQEAEKQQPRFFFDLFHMPYAQPDSLPPGSYRITVALYANNATVRRQRFQIDWSGHWNDDEREMLRREAVIRKI